MLYLVTNKLDEEHKMEVQVNEKTLTDKSKFQATNGDVIMVTPAIDESFWLFRVPLTESQAIVAFPKFTVIGIGFQKEEDWNTNLPSNCDAEEIFNHISHNKSDDNISDNDCIKAIQMLKDFIDRQ